MINNYTEQYAVKYHYTGYVCKREDVKGNGCCKIIEEESTRYSCEKCHNQSGCCGVYEICVSCCMHPSNVRLFENSFVIIRAKRLDF